MLLWLIVSVMFLDPCVEADRIGQVASFQFVQSAEPPPTGRTILTGYVDPGTGSIILQGLLAGIITALVFFKGWFAKIKGFFKREHPVESEEEKKPSDDG